MLPFSRPHGEAAKLLCGRRSSTRVDELSEVNQAGSMSDA